MIKTKMNRADSDMGGAIKQCDAIELMQTLSDSYVDLLLTDIPYARVNKPSNGLRVIDKKQANKETFDLQSFAREAFRVTKGNAVIFCGKEQFSTLYGYFDDWGATTRNDSMGKDQSNADEWTLCVFIWCRVRRPFSQEASDIQR